MVKSIGSIIGLDIGAAGVRAVQLGGGAGADGRCVVSACAMFERSESGGAVSPGEAWRIAGVLERNGFRGRRVALGVPDSRLVTNAFEVSAKSGGSRGAAPPVDLVGRVELARSIGANPQALEAACWTLPGGSRSKETVAAIAAGCLHAEAGPLLDALEGAGLVVSRLEARPTALVRACGLLMAGKSGVGAVVDLDEGGAMMAVAYRGVVTYYRHSAEHGLDRHAERLAADLDVEPETARHLMFRGTGGDSGENSLLEGAAMIRGEYLESLSQELALALSYGLHRYPDATADHVLIVGAGSRLPNVADELSKRLAVVDVTVVRPCEVAGFGAGLGARCERAELMGALGLAMGGEA